MYAKTKPIIDKRLRKTFWNGERSHSRASAIEQQELDGTRYWIGKKGSELAGAVMQVEAQGYGSEPIQMMVGVDTDGTVTDVKIVAMSETPGIGTRVKDEAFCPGLEVTAIPPGLTAFQGLLCLQGQ